MGEEIKKILYIDPPFKNDLERAPYFYGSPDHPYDQTWVETYDGRVMTSSFEMLGIHITRSRKLLEPPQNATYATTALRLHAWMEDMIRHHSRAMSGKINEVKDRIGEKFDAIFVRSGSVVDLMIAAAANIFLQETAYGPLNIFLDATSYMEDVIDSDTILGDVETEKFYGDPHDPHNKGISDVLLKYLENPQNVIRQVSSLPFFSDQTVQPENSLEPADLDFLRSMRGYSIGGIRMMLPQVLPYISAVIMYPNSPLSLFIGEYMHDDTVDLRIKRRDLRFQEEIEVVTALDEVLKRVGDRKPTVPDHDVITLFSRRARLTKFNPEKVRGHLLVNHPIQAWSDNTRVLVAELVKRDLMKSFENIREIEETIKAIKLRYSAVERSR